MNLEQGNFIAILWSQLHLVLPELILAAGMCGVILVPFIRRESRTAPVVVTLITLAAALLTALMSLQNLGGSGYFLFGPDMSLTDTTGMLAIDSFSQTVKVLILLFTLFVVVQWMLSNTRDTHTYDIPDFACLLLGATLGMSLMVSANNLLAIFMAIEAASLPSFALAGFRKLTKPGSEGSMKYVVFGAAASAISVYGMSLIYGMTGTLDLGLVGQAAANDLSPLLAVGIAGMLIGIAFKLSAVPVHFWCPDVFQGASFEVATFLSVASKGAAIALLLRVVQAFGVAAEPDESSALGLVVGLAILGGVTATWGNLVALHQTNIKRLLAYSSIAQAGYMIMGVAVAAAAPELLSVDVVTNAVLFYLFVYLFMNLGAFTVGSIIHQQTGSEDIRDYNGMMRRAPVLAVLLSLFMLSLFGMPGLGGFIGKIYLATAMSKLGWGGTAMIIVLLINTVISLYFYVRPTIIMIVEKDDQTRGPIAVRPAAVALLGFCAAALLWTGVLPQAATSLVSQDRALKQRVPVAPIAIEPPIAQQPAPEPTLEPEQDRPHGS